MHRQLGVMMAIVVVVGCGGTRETPPSPATETTLGGGAYASPSVAAPVGATSGDFAAEVVAVDPAARTVTLRESAVGGTAAGKATTGATAAGATTTVRVEGTAGDTLGDFKTGDKVVVSCVLGGGMTGTGTTGTTGISAAGTLSDCTSVTAIRKAT